MLIADYTVTKAEFDHVKATAYRLWCCAYAESLKHLGENPETPAKAAAFADDAANQYLSRFSKVEAETVPAEDPTRPSSPSPMVF